VKVPSTSPTTSIGDQTGFPREFRRRSSGVGSRVGSLSLAGHRDGGARTVSVAIGTTDAGRIQTRWRRKPGSRIHVATGFTGFQIESFAPPNHVGHINQHTLLTGRRFDRPSAVFGFPRNELSDHPARFSATAPARPRIGAAHRPGGPARCDRIGRLRPTRSQHLNQVKTAMQTAFATENGKTTA